MAALLDSAEPGAAPIPELISAGLPAALVRFVAESGSAPQALVQACWLIGSLAAAGQAAVESLVTAGGAPALVGLLGRVVLLLDSTAAPSPVSSLAADADLPLHSLVALCAVADLPAGAASLLDAGAVEAVAALLIAHEAALPVSAVEAGCRALEALMLRNDGAEFASSGGCARLMACGGLDALLQVLLSPRAAADDELAVQAMGAILAALACEGAAVAGEAAARVAAQAPALRALVMGRGSSGDPSVISAAILDRFAVVLRLEEPADQLPGLCV